MLMSFLHQGTGVFDVNKEDGEMDEEPPPWSQRTCRSTACANALGVGLGFHMDLGGLGHSPSGLVHYHQPRPGTHLQPGILGA